MYKLLQIILILSFIVGCSAFTSSEQTASSSLVDFLYPNQKDYKEHQPTTPYLSLPINVGIAFVPGSKYSSLSLSAKQKYEILSKVKSEFSERQYINRIEIISDSYLKKGGGFDNLEQLSGLYGIEVMALVSYDQVARNTQNNAALFYWTIAGMYLIPGDENVTQTFVDTAVFDINSNKLLFRAPGISKVESLSTAIGLDDTLYQNSSEGFELAATDMVSNLNTELELFKVRVKEEKVAEVSYKSGYSGGGSVNWWLIGIAALFFIIRKKLAGAKK